MIGFGGRGAQPRDERGGASLELVILTPALMGLLSLIMAFAQYAQTENFVDQAARDGARSATAQNVKADAAKVAREAAAGSLVDADESCRDPSSLSVTTTMSSGAFEPPNPDDPLDIETVTVRVRCTVDLSRLAFLPLGEVRIERTFTSPLDRYRGYR